jgi:hypothetical protein
MCASLRSKRGAAAFLKGAKPKLDLRKREVERQEVEHAETDAYNARVAQCDLEARTRPVDRGRPGYARGA